MSWQQYLLLCSAMEGCRLWAIKGGCGGVITNKGDKVGPQLRSRL